VCGVTDGGRCGSLIWQGTMGKGRESMRGEGEPDGLKKKVRRIGPCWAISSSWAGIPWNEGNESRRK
jgi:hypothetical protein